MTSFTSQNLVNIPADSQYLPRSSDLPESVLDQTAGALPADPPDEAEISSLWDDLDGRSIKQLNALLPRARQVRHWRCWRQAVHIRKHAADGGVSEAIHGMSCGDRATCRRCSVRYANDRYAEHVERFQMLLKATRAAVDFVTISAVIPQWCADAKVGGCDTAEACGGLCLKATGCPACDSARAASDRMAAAEHEAVAALRALWQRHSANTGGISDVKPCWPSLGGPIHLVFTLVVPQVAMHLPAGADTGVHKTYTRVDLAQLYDDFAAWLAEQHPGAYLVDGKHEQVNPCAPGSRMVPNTVVATEEFRRSFSALHEPAWLQFNRAVADTLESGGVVTPTHARTFARACGLTATTVTGRNRRHQRTAYFGFLAGPKAPLILRGLNIDVVTDDQRPARTEVVDVYRVIHHLPDGNIVVQSKRSGTMSVPDRHIVRFTPDAAVDSNGRPAHGRSKTTWVFQGQFTMGRWHSKKAKQEAAARYARVDEAMNRGVAIDSVEFANIVGGKSSHGTR